MHLKLICTQTGCFSYDSASKTWNVNTSSPLVQRQDEVIPYISSEGVEHLARYTQVASSDQSLVMEDVQPTSVVIQELRLGAALGSPKHTHFDPFEIFDVIGQWTTIVIDLQLMVKGDLFPHLVETRWTVLIPTPSEYHWPYESGAC